MGQAKGKKQVLWEWGLWKEGMILTIDDTDERGRSQDLSMDHTLQVSSSLCGRVCWLTSSWQACTCFATEETALQHLVQSRGHILMMSVKGTRKWLDLASNTAGGSLSMTTARIMIV